jgi:hypothetical protein
VTDRIVDIEHKPLPWRKLIVLAAIGTVLCVAQILPQNLRTVQGFARMIEPGSTAAATPLIHHDFPRLQLVPGVGHDGQSFYAIARSPMHLNEVSKYLDRPQYRAQRILFPLLAWMLHPTGGGIGLIAALVAVGIAALFIGGVSLGALSASLGGRVEVAVFFALLPGAASSLNLSVADGLAIALALAAIALDVRRHPHAAIAAGIGAALTKESLILVLIGYALWRRDRQGLRLAGIPTLVAGAWWCILHFTLPSSGKQVVEFDPGHGLFVSVRYWLHGNQVDGAVVFGLALCAAFLALRRGAWRTPLGYAIVLQLAFVLTLAGNVIAVPDNGARATLPLLALSVAALTVPLPTSPAEVPEPDELSSPRAALASAR